MINEEKMVFLHRSLNRVFALPISRSTFREIQNAVLHAAHGNKDEGNAIFECLLSGEYKEFPGSKPVEKDLKKIIEEFSVKAWVAKDVFEKGEFISLITSDIVNHPNHFVFSNRIRRVDGQEIQFVTDLESTIQLLHHFLGRLQEAHKFDNAKKGLKDHQKEISALKGKIDEVLSAK